MVQSHLPFQGELRDTPNAPNNSIRSSLLNMADREYHRNYWKSYKKKTRQISLTASLEDYKMWKNAAEQQGRRSVGQQIKAEALAYRSQEHLPELDTQNYLTELIRILRGIGNNLNQLAHQSNSFKRMIGEREAIKMLKELEHTAEGFTKSTKALSTHSLEG